MEQVNIMSQQEGRTEELTSKANAAFQLAAAEVIRKAKETGTPIVVWEDNRIKKLTPAEVEDQAILEDNEAFE